MYSEAHIIVGDVRIESNVNSITVGQEADRLGAAKPLDSIMDDVPILNFHTVPPRVV